MLARRDSAPCSDGEREVQLVQDDVGDLEQREFGGFG
jgi:hypothetical protein